MISVSTIIEADQKIPGLREQGATRLALFIPGVILSAWAPLVPYVKARAGLDEGALGLLLLCLGLGSILAMPLSGAWARKAGCRTVITVATVAAVLMLPVLATSASVPGLAVALFVFGAGIGSMDCVANIQAVIVERASGKTLMSGFHGFYSLGGLAGAGGSAALLTLGVAPLGVAGIVVVLTAGLLLWARPGLLPYAAKGDGPAFALPHGVVVFIAALCFVVFLAEGAALDWSAVFLTAERGVEPAMAGLGFAAFSLTMTAGRLIGDRIVERLGRARVLLFGGLLAATGMAVAVLVPAWPAALVGYALLGAGCSNLVPVLFSAIGRQTDMPEHLAVPAVTTVGYAGILAGPAGIGWIAHASSLPLAFGVVAGLLALVATSSQLLKL